MRVPCPAAASRPRVTHAGRENSGGGGMGRQRLGHHRACLVPLTDDLDEADLAHFGEAQAGALLDGLQLRFELLIEFDGDAALLGCSLFAHVGIVGIANNESNNILLDLCDFVRFVGMSTTKGRNLGLRLDEQDTRDLEDFERGSGIEATTLARNAVRACLAYWKQHKKISFPLRLVEAAADSKSAAHQKLSEGAPATSDLVLNEDSPPTNIESMPPRKDTSYGSGKKKPKKNGTED